MKRSANAKSASGTREHTKQAAISASPAPVTHPVRAKRGVDMVSEDAVVVNEDEDEDNDEEDIDFYEGDEEENASVPPSALAALADPSAFPLELLQKLYPGPGSDSSADTDLVVARLAAAPASSTGHTQRLPPPSSLLSRLAAFAPLTADPTAPISSGPLPGSGPAAHSEGGLELTRAQARERIAAGGDVIQMTLALGVLDINGPATDDAGAIAEATEEDIARAAAASAAGASAGSAGSRAGSSAGAGEGLVLPAALARALAAREAAGSAGENDEGDEGAADDDEEDCDDDVICRAIDDEADSDNEVAEIHRKAGVATRRGPKKPDVVPVAADANGKLPIG